MANLIFFKSLNQLNFDSYTLSYADKIELINQICFSIQYGYLPSEKDLIVNTIKKLISSGSVEINSLIADNLKDSDNYPKELAIKLAYNVNEVAIPIIKYSPLLSNDNLLSMLHDFKSIEKLSAIAMRSNIDESVSNKIINMRKPALIIKLLSNETSIININLYRIILNLYYMNSSCVKAAINRYQQKSTQFCSILIECDDDVKNYIIKHYEKDIDIFYMQQLESELSYRRENLIIKRQEIDQIFNYQGLKSLLVIRYLCKGDLYSFLYCISKITETPFDLVETLAFDSHLSTQFKSLYFDSQLPNDLYSAVKILLQTLVKASISVNQVDFKSIIDDIKSNTTLMNETPKLKYLLELV